jgi:hypothetical protein
MSAWTSDELSRIEAAEELDLASARRDGTLRRPVTMWVVRHGDDLYVRSVNGRESSWFRGAQTSHEAHIQAGGVGKDVSLIETDDVNDGLDGAYRTKYGRYAAGIIDAITSPAARAATLKLVQQRRLADHTGRSSISGELGAHGRSLSNRHALVTTPGWDANISPKLSENTAR